MVTFTTGSGKMIKHMDSEPTVTWMVRSTRVTGRRISSMDMDLRLGQMEPAMKVTIWRGASMDKVASDGLTRVLTLANSKRIISKATVS